ncbi:putative NADH-cytochrome b5 reductase [Cantharellus anzutake]|uniref:putative NADH-cytochrome b5 reductase n=1 Tax=Cantharellus anzutake TaxID=1750568 RepID=UPI0019074D8E|nr:putative NADH-cytochrome b5 reductase [Cantharellus anzutake]KAF8328153.1 putative NADH-cytochrome b5 reductase [Cantharellus anzutake]
MSQSLFQKLTAFIQTPLGLSVALGGGFILVFYFLLQTKHHRREPVLSPDAWREFPIVEKIKISPNTALYRFGLPDPEDNLGLPAGQHITIAAEIDGKDIVRNYTPTTGNDDLGHFDLVVKTYEKGNVSRYLSLLKIGDKGQFRYSPELAAEFGLIAGGTGITPMLQVVRYSLFNPGDPTKFSLIYANVNEEDILLKTELDYLVAMFPYRFKVYYVLNNPPAGWKGGVGFVSKEHIAEYLPGPGPEAKILVCGPPPMVTAMKGHLDALKYPAPRTVSKVDDPVFIF